MAIDPQVFKQVRKALGLTQEELADALGLSRVTVNRMERGKLIAGIPDEIGGRLMSLNRSDVKEEVTVSFPQLADEVEMERALRDDGEKLRQLTGEDHGPYFINDPHLWDNEEDES